MCIVPYKGAAYAGSRQRHLQEPTSGSCFCLGFDPPATACKTSPLVTMPLGPVGAMSDGESPCSCSSTLAAGPMRTFTGVCCPLVEASGSASGSERHSRMSGSCSAGTPWGTVWTAGSCRLLSWCMQWQAMVMLDWELFSGLKGRAMPSMGHHCCVPLLACLCKAASATIYSY